MVQYGDCVMVNGVTFTYLRNSRNYLTKSKAKGKAKRKLEFGSPK